MNSPRSWILFTLIRVGIFAVALAALLLLGVNPFISAAGAAIIGFCVSYIFFRKPRDEVAKSIAARRGAHDHDHDNEVENELLDRFEQDGRQ